MSKAKYTNFKCKECENGVAILISTDKGNSTEIKTKDCNVCGCFYGVLGIHKLQKIKNNEQD